MRGAHEQIRYQIQWLASLHRYRSLDCPRHIIFHWLMEFISTFIGQQTQFKFENVFCFGLRATRQTTRHRIMSYYPEGLKWSDGSVECDLPMERLSELFNVNHFIVSQVNIHYKFISGYNSFGTSVVADLLLYMKKQMKAYMKHAAKLGFNTSFLRILRIGWIPFLTQSYEGDITICPVRACSVGCGRNQQKRPFYAG